MLNRQVGWHLALEDAIDIASRASILILRIGPIRDQAADRRINTARIDGRESAPIRQCYNPRAVSLRGRAQGHDQTTVRRTCEIGEHPFELADIARIDRLQLHPERRRRGLHGGELASAQRPVRIQLGLVVSLARARKRTSRPVLYWPQTVIGATRTGANPKESHPMRKDTLLITAIAFGLTLAGIAGAEDQPISEQIVDVMNKVFGVHPGFRANHAKGIVAEGHFTGAPEALGLSRAVLFNGSPIPVTVRFSNSTGVPISRTA